jgi:hypothetical protein
MTTAQQIATRSRPSCRVSRRRAGCHALGPRRALRGVHREGVAIRRGRGHGRMSTPAGLSRRWPRAPRHWPGFGARRHGRSAASGVCFAGPHNGTTQERWASPQDTSRRPIRPRHADPASRADQDARAPLGGSTASARDLDIRRESAPPRGLLECLGPARSWGPLARLARGDRATRPTGRGGGVGWPQA